VLTELDTKLKAFVPEYIPAIGEVDAFLKMPRPDGQPETMGLYVLVWKLVLRTNRPWTSQTRPRSISSLSTMTNATEEENITRFTVLKVQRRIPNRYYSG
jgi:intraflagellar transport protein 46